MTDNIRKEELSISYLNTICAYSGISLERNRHDEDSIDVIVKKQMVRNDGQLFDAELGIQLKSTSMNLKENEAYITYCLRMKNYNDLRRDSTIPRILGLLVLPTDENEWISWSVDQLLIRKCMYWIDLKKCPGSKNTSEVSVAIPKSNVLSSESLMAIMKSVAEEEFV